MSQRTARRISVLPSPKVDPWPMLWQSFERGLRAGSGTKNGRPASPRTLEIYADGGRVFHDWSVERNLPTDPKQILREQVDDFLIWLRDEREAKPATVRARFSALRRFFNWCAEEGEIDHSPMDRMRGVKVDEPPPAVLSDDQVRRLFEACKGADFDDRRDSALLSVMLDCGLRRAEVAGIMVEDLDLTAQHITIRRRKGGKQDVVRFGPMTARDLDRYLRVRPRHSKADLPALWLAQKGALSGDGIHHVIARRARMAGIEGLHPHVLRHQFAHSLKAAGASDEDIMELGAWADMKSMRRYGAAARQARAWETHRRLSPRDRI